MKLSVPTGVVAPDTAQVSREGAEVRGGVGTLARSILGCVAAAAALLAVYFGLLTLLSGWEFTQDEFARFWPYIVALASGFGIQVGLFLYLRGVVRAHHSGTVVAVSGGASGTAMLSCCSHYLVNLLPALGATGLVSLVGQYQVELFWLGLAANLAGIGYIASRLRAALVEASCG